jgi:antitoxin VapB
MTVALTIKNPEVERLAAEVARLTGETKTHAIREALQERHSRLAIGVDRDARRAELLRFMQEEIWVHVPPELRGQPHDAARDDAILGYVPHGLPE